MFTGLVEDVGQVVSAERGAAGSRLSIETALPEADLWVGASVAVDGACLTVVSSTSAGQGRTRFFADVSSETLQRTTLGSLQARARVNLERPLAVGERLGGHLVLGHVDGVGRIAERTALGNTLRVKLELPPALLPLVVEKGSLCLDGISLTVNAVGPSDVSLLLIPETLRATTWADKPLGAPVNVEVDVLAKHVARLLAAQLGKLPGAAGGLDLDKLTRAGFAG